MRPLRRQRTPPGSDSIAGVTLPPVRVGLLAKLNVLTLGMLALALAATSFYYLVREQMNEDGELRGHGSATLLLLASAVEPGFAPANSGQFARLLDGLASDDDIAYVAVVNAEGHPLVERRYVASSGAGPLPR